MYETPLTVASGDAYVFFFLLQEKEQKKSRSGQQTMSPNWTAHVIAYHEIVETIHQLLEIFLVAPMFAMEVRRADDHFAAVVALPCLRHFIFLYTKYPSLVFHCSCDKSTVYVLPLLL